MTQEERLVCLIEYLLSENKAYDSVVIPENVGEQKLLLRALMNLRLPNAIPDTIRTIQDDYLQEEFNHSIITDWQDLPYMKKQIKLWKGDITKLKVDAIVNAGNSELLGCFIPNHGCIDNAIHSYAGIQLRLACHELMMQQGSPEPVGRAKITKGYALPASYVIHTVGPRIVSQVTKQDIADLLSCYRSCLALAEQHHLTSIAFCCISTGEFHFPNALAAELAIETVEEYLSETQSEIEVIFNVFQQKDYELYLRFLQTSATTKG